MPDIIQILPDAVANQIAAGEVVQRPSSVIKELLENSIDAGADWIQIVVREAGKQLIQVVDNGLGMTDTDARMSFERHATSKIKCAGDLFKIKSMGFRGEALAAISAVSQVSLKSRKHDRETGTEIVIEGSDVKSQQTVSCAAGTSIAVKNLFYNIPARRNFLKSTASELRHLIDDFQKIALSYPDIYFSFINESIEIFQLHRGSLKQRVTHIFGNAYAERLVPLEEETSVMNVHGFIGKPEFAKKTRGEQFFFVNSRFIRDPYLHHAVMNAYQDLLPAESVPFYAIFLTLDPTKIDINVHPAKTEIKFDDEKVIYSILRAVVKRSLGKFNITPTIDFNAETGFAEIGDQVALSGVAPKPPVIRFDPHFNPFLEKNQNGEKAWRDLYAIAEESSPSSHPLFNESPQMRTTADKSSVFQLHGRFILSPIKSGYIVLDQQAAHERILYEKYLKNFNNQKNSIQQTLFPETITFTTSDFELLKELWNDIAHMGFDFRNFGKNTVVLEGIPADMVDGNTHGLLEDLIKGYKENLSFQSLEKRDNLAKSLAKKTAIKNGKELSEKEMNLIIDLLFACDIPGFGLSGKPTYITHTLSDLIKKFS